MKSSLLNGALPDRRPCTTSMAELVVGFPVFLHDLLVVFRSSFSITIGIWFYLLESVKIVLNENNHILMICLLLILGKIINL